MSSCSTPPPTPTAKRQVIHPPRTNQPKQAKLYKDLLMEYKEDLYAFEVAMSELFPAGITTLLAEYTVLNMHDRAPYPETMVSNKCLIGPRLPVKLLRKLQRCGNCRRPHYMQDQCQICSFSRRLNF